MAIRSDHLVVSLTFDHVHYIFLYGHTKQNREGGGKEQTNNTGLGQLQAQEGGSLCDTFCAALRAFEDYHRRVFCAKLPQKPLAMLTFIDCALLLFLTALSSRLVSPALLCQLPLSVFPPPLPVSLEISPSVPLCGFHAKADKEILRPAPVQTEMFVCQLFSLSLFLSLSLYIYS